MNPLLPIASGQSPLVLLDLLFKLKIKDVMSTALITCRRCDPMRKAQDLMRANRITGLPVVEDGRLFGIVSMEDVIRTIESGRIYEGVGGHMSTNVVVLEEDMPLSFGASYFDKYRFGRFPVLNKDNRVVGILTSRDVSASLLLELFKEYSRLESKMQPPEPPAGVDRVLLQFSIKQYDFENAGKASHELKKTLTARRIEPRLIRRAAVAAYEMEINQTVHSLGGTLTCTVDPRRIEIAAVDRGPGIPDVELAVQEGYTTANDWIKSLGFGAGMGLGNIKRVADDFFIESRTGGSTTVRCVIHLPAAAEPGPEGTRDAHP